LVVGQSVIANRAVQLLANPARAPFLGRHPRPLDKGRRVADVLLMAALKIGDPMGLGVSMEADDASLHAGHDSTRDKFGPSTILEPTLPPRVLWDVPGGITCPTMSEGLARRLAFSRGQAMYPLAPV
jgi:hypothetical protein